MFWFFRRQSLSERVFCNPFEIPEFVNITSRSQLQSDVHSEAAGLPVDAFSMGFLSFQFLTRCISRVKRTK